MLDTTYRERLKTKSIPILKKLATEEFNLFIRTRDKDKVCISCRKGKVEQAGHFYSAGHHAGLRFNENNVHGQCVRCNHFLSGNLSNYRVWIIEKIGTMGLDKLDFDAAFYAKNGYKWDRQTLIEIIIKYKALNSK